MTTTTLRGIAAKAEAAAAALRKPVSSTAITDAVYPKKGSQSRRPVASRPPRKPRGTSIGELLPASQAVALIALEAELRNRKHRTGSTAS